MMNGRALSVMAALVAASACVVGGASGPASTPHSTVARGSTRPAVAAAAVATERVPQFGRFEVQWDARGTPDSAPSPAASPGTADFTAPSGRVTRVEAFASGGVARVRFSPREVGTYRYEIHEPARERGASTVSGAFEATPGTDRGSVRVDPERPHRLAFEDGTPFFILGENRINIYDPSWNYQGKGIDDYVRGMAEEGMTTLRVFIGADAVPVTPSDTRGLGCLEPALGQYDEAVARRFDAILDAAEAHGVYVILTAFAVGFTPGDAWKSWEDNPYSSARGGPARVPAEFFTDASARAYAERRLRYIVARWGYSTHLLAIDLLNEPEWDGAVAESTWIPWAAAMGTTVRAADPYGHLVTVGSVGLQWNIDGDEKPLYAGTTEDLIEWHLYGEKTYDPRANALEMARKVRETYAYGKPVFCGEFAYGGEDPAHYDHTHDGIWAAVFAGGGALAHSAPPFNVDSDEPMTPARGQHFRVLADFLRSLHDAARLEPDDGVRVSRPAGATVLALGSDEEKAFWLLGPARGYGAPVRGARLFIEGLPKERVRVAFRNDVTGDSLASYEAESEGGTLSVDVPTFERHVAGTIEAVARAPGAQ